MSVTIYGTVNLNGLDNMLKAAGDKAPWALARGINRATLPVANAAKREIRKILGLRKHPYAKGTVRQALNRNTSVRPATRASLKFSMAGFGSGLPAIYYAPKESPLGASINWLGQRKLIKRSFYLSGKFPRRRRSSISHVVWERTGKGRWDLTRPRGPGVPDVMLQKTLMAKWRRDAEARVPHHLRSALESLLAGHFKSR